MVFERIATNQAITAREPCIRGTRIPVATIVADVMTPAEIVTDFPQLVGEASATHSCSPRPPLMGAH